MIYEILQEIRQIRLARQVERVALCVERLESREFMRRYDKRSRRRENGEKEMRRSQRGDFAACTLAGIK